MNDDEAQAEIRHLKGLFPMVTVEQMDYWFLKFRGYERLSVQQAIERYADLHNGQDVDRNSFRTLLDACSGRNTSNERIRQVMLESDDHCRRVMSDREKAEDSEAQVNLVLSQLSDEELSELKKATIAANPDLEKFLGRKDAKTSRALRALMSQNLSPARK